MLLTGKKNKGLIRAAGGLVWRETGGDREILVIHRPRYNDWSLPKGKLETGERWEDAALREVLEETGYTTTLDSFAGLTFYYDNDRPKVVLFWNMKVMDSDPEMEGGSDNPDEVDQVVWLTVKEALKRLSYGGEAALLHQESFRMNRNLDVELG